MEPGKLVCFGFGFTATRLAERLVVSGWRVAGTTRSPEKMASLVDRGIEATVFSGDASGDGVPALLEGATHILNTVPPSPDGDRVLALHAGDILACPTLRWLGYLSTSGVYGHQDGNWIDETATVNPASERGRRRVLAERQWLGLALPVQVFRLPGIYGPGRSPIDQIRAGKARRIDKPGQVFNRIHVDDIATTLMASMAAPRPGRIYNVSDDEPAPSEQVVAYAAHLLGREPPPLVPFDKAAMTSMARSFYSESKRLDNTRIKRELGVRLAHPTYRQGLEAIVRSMPDLIHEEGKQA